MGWDYNLFNEKILLEIFSGISSRGDHIIFSKSGFKVEHTGFVMINSRLSGTVKQRSSTLQIIDLYLSILSLNDRCHDRGRACNSAILKA